MVDINEIIHNAVIPSVMKNRLIFHAEHERRDFVVSCYEAYNGTQVEGMFFKECRELIANSKDKGYFRGLRQAVDKLALSQLSEPYISGWEFGFKSGITYEGSRNK